MHRSKHGALYQDFNCEEDEDTSPETAYCRRNFMAIIFLRKIAYFVGIVLAYDIALLQMTITCCSGLILLICLIKFKPYDKSRDAWMNVGTEVMIFIIHMVIFIFAGDDIAQRMSIDQRKTVGWVVIGLCSTLVVYNALFVFALQIMQIVEFFKKIKLFLSKKKAKSQKSQNNSIQEKSNIVSEEPRNRTGNTARNESPRRENQTVDRSQQHIQPKIKDTTLILQRKNKPKVIITKKRFYTDSNVQKT